MATTVQKKYYQYLDPSNVNYGGQGLFMEAGPEVPNQPGFQEVSLQQYTDWAKAFKPIVGKTNIPIQQGESYYDFINRTSPQTLQGGSSGYVINDQGVLQQEAQYNQAKALASDPNQINVGTATAPLYVPKGSPGAANLAGTSQADYLKTPEAAAFLAANPGVTAVTPTASPLATLDGGQVGMASIEKPYYKYTNADEVYNTQTGEHITAEEAAKIPDFWSQVENVTPGVKVQYGAPAPIPTNEITPEKLADIPKTIDVSGIKISNPTSSVASTIAMADQTNKTLQDFIKARTPEATATSKQADTLTSQLSSLLGQEAGKTAMSADEQAKAGVQQFNEQLTNLNNEIGIKNAALKVLMADLESKPITMNSIIGAEAIARSKVEADIGFLTAQATAMMNNITFAKQQAQDAVDKKYGPIEEEIAIKTAQLKLLEPTLTKEENIQAQAQTDFLNYQQKQIDDAKNAETTLINYNLDAMTKYPSAGIRTTDTFQSTQTKILASAEYKVAMETKTETGTTDMQEYAVSQSQGYKGTLLDWQTQQANLKSKAGRAATQTYSDIKDANGNIIGKRNNTTNEFTPINISTADTKSGLIAQATQAFEAMVGDKDHYVSPDTWSQLRATWLQQGGILKDFVDNFEVYKNPEDTYL